MNGVIGSKGSRLESKIANLAKCFVTDCSTSRCRQHSLRCMVDTPDLLSDELGWGGARGIPALSFEHLSGFRCVCVCVCDTMARMMVIACFGYDDTSKPILIPCRVGG